MDTIEARKTFEEALEEASKIKFYEYKHGKFDRDIRIIKRPKAVEICKEKNCNAGYDCCHRFVKRNIPLCVY